jgi:Caspase domain/Domain of unknown function (DUF4384)
MKRRKLLQSTGYFLTALGLSQLDIRRQGDRYARVLAQTTGRKLALLVGINSYPGGDELKGCLTDVELQKQLLIHRFGFNEKDIRILTNEQATRQGILTAFETHLIDQAKPQDVVVFHFSGHGSQVADPDTHEPDGLNSTLVPVDNNVPLKNRKEKAIVPDIMGRTLFLLMSAIKTENVTVVLDCCHSGGGKRGNLTLRALDGGSHLLPSPQEIEYQKQWLSRLNLSEAEYKERRKAGVAKGVVITATNRKQLAADTRFSGFGAGAFTYIFTQYLWQQTGDEPLSSAIANIARSTTEISTTSQVPEYEAKPGSDRDRQPIYLISKQTPPAEAAITSVQGDAVTLWLGGVGVQSLKAFDKGGLFTAIDSAGKEQGMVQLDSASRQGLTARGKLKDTQPGAIKVGTLLRERVRAIPTDLNLRIGLDPSLGADLATAERVLKAIARIQPFAVQTAEVEYILGRITDNNRQFQTKPDEQMPAKGSIGLFTPGLEIIPGSFGSANESFAVALTRLQAKFKSLLAVRMVKTILNPGSSRLNVTVSVSPNNGNEILASTFTARGGGGRTEALPTATWQRISLGTPLQFKVMNRENRDLYVSVLVIDPEGQMTVIFPNTWTAADDATLVKAGETLSIPQPGKDRFRLTVQKPLGMVEVLAIASATSLQEALKAFQTVAARGGSGSGPIGLDEDPTLVIDKLLIDLNKGTRGGGIAVELDRDAAGIDSNQLAAMSITFESIASLTGN